MLWPNGSKNRPRLSGEGTAKEAEADFGPRKTGKGFHDGVDLAALFVRVCAVLAGEVIRVEKWDGKPPKTTQTQHGNRVWIDHGNGVVTTYSHLAPNSVTVKKGDRVAEGQHIGNLGSTGYTDGPHLHFEVHVNGRLVDPVPFVAYRINPAIPTGTPTGTPTPAPTEDDDMTMDLIEHAGNDVQGGWYVAGPGHWHRLTPPELDQALLGAVGDFKRRSTGGNWALLVRWHDIYAPPGIDLNGNPGVVVDVETIAARTAIAARDAVQAAIEAAGVVVDIDEDAIAKRVRDEFTANPLR